ncbi:MAG TPA: glycosyltransferase family 4 protein [Angustibacter sp.]|nr:glycosyltransferase family 4 protein [Angustibacter sp.]
MPLAAPAERSVPRVVLFRPSPIDRDTRAKKIALTLARGGYDVVVLTPVRPGEPRDERRLGPVRVLPVLLETTHQDVHNLGIAHRRRRRVALISRLPVDEYVTRLNERRARARRAAATARRRRAAVSLTSPRGLAAAVRWALARSLSVEARTSATVLRARQEGQVRLDRLVRRGWTAYDERRRSSTLLATDHGSLPELVDIGRAFWKALDDLQPDVLHAHHPLVLPAALRAARRLRAQGRACQVVYDARENFAGIPEAEQGSPRRHAVLVRQEARTIRDVDAVITVSDPIADELRSRYQLPQRPSVVLNVPVRAAGAAAGPTVREAAGVGTDVPLLVYSGGISRARGLDVLVRSLADLPGVHLVLVPVPHPHPMTPELNALAAELGVADRLHVVPPTDQDHLIRYLSGADVAVHPMPGGSPNHDQALPNKLFEYLHARLPLVVSDARLMAEFVRTNDLGAVFTSGDPATLAAAVRQVLDHRPDDAHLDDLAAAFSWQGQERALLDLYASLVPPAGAGDAQLSADFPSLEVTGDGSRLDLPASPEQM